jgi:hypothetical protein
MTLWLRHLQLPVYADCSLSQLRRKRFQQEDRSSSSRQDSWQHNEPSLPRRFAATLEQAREELSTVNLEDDPIASPAVATPAISSTPITPADIPPEDSFSLAFDIDGVLIRGGNPIPEAIEAMKVLNGENEFGVRM